jgi:hypothetical protein
MSLHKVLEGALARRVAAGDEIAFNELACRYRGLIGLMTRAPGPGVERAELSQAALLGLWDACRLFDASEGAFSPLARVCMRRRVWNAWNRARRVKHRVLTDAVGLDQRDGPRGDGDDPTIAERLPARDGFDPARVTAARETLAELTIAVKALSPGYRAALWSEGTATARARYHARQRLRALLERGPVAASSLRDGRRYSDDQIRQALALVAHGASDRQAGAFVGASATAVFRWRQKAA